ncbi:MAG: RNA polymerase sigma-70 factor [Bacteroidales bacterium]
MNNNLPDTFNSLYTQYYNKAFLFTKSYIHDDMASEDIVANVLIKIWQISENQTINNFKGLLLTMLKNSCLDHLKHQKIVESYGQKYSEILKRELDFRISTLSACNPDKILCAEIEDIVSNTLSSLSKESRLIFEMSRFSDKKNIEIAQELQISVKTVEYHISKVLRILRKNLKDYLPIITFFI